MSEPTLRLVPKFDRCEYPRIYPHIAERRREERTRSLVFWAVLGLGIALLIITSDWPMWSVR